MKRLKLSLFLICLSSIIFAEEQTDKDKDLFETCQKLIDQMCPKNNFDRLTREGLRECIVEVIPKLNEECAKHIEQGLGRGNLDQGLPVDRSRDQ